MTAKPRLNPLTRSGRPKRQGKPAPESEKDWTVHAINIHGAFFEAWCRDLVDRIPGWSLAYYKYPVKWGSEASELDVRADLQVGLTRVSLLIECKKGNPELTEWVFLRKRRVFTATPSLVANLQLEVDAAGRVRLATSAMKGFPWMSTVADDGRETRKDYRRYTDMGTKTKTSSTAIYDAAKQVSIAYRAIVSEESSRANRQVPEVIVAHTPRDLVFLPVIVTTARLHVCDFDPKDVDPASGELPWDRAALTEVTHLRYEFTLPAALQWPTESLGQGDFPDWTEPGIRQWIGVVNSAYFERFLLHYAEHMESWVHMRPFPDQPDAATESVPESEPSATE